jgi:hypothetical protein
MHHPFQPCAVDLNLDELQKLCDEAVTDDSDGPRVSQWRFMFVACDALPKLIAELRGLRQRLASEEKRSCSLERALAEHEWRSELVTLAAKGDVVGVRQKLDRRPEFEGGKFG